MRLAIHVFGLILFLMDATTASCQIDPAAQVKDEAGTVYPVVKLADGNYWLARNLNVNIPGSYCYQNSDSLCAQYGRLYTWKAAQEGCKTLGANWHLPTDAEWRQLTKQYGGVRGESEDDGKSAFRNLIAHGASGFDVVLGGSRGSDGNFKRLNEHGYLWSATESDSANAYFFNFGGLKIINRHPDGEKDWAISVRCVRP